MDSQIQTMDANEKKKRKPNFSDIEKNRLVEEYEKEFTVLSSKFGPNVTTKKKHDAWLRVVTAMNGRSPSVVRTSNELQKKWQAMCSEMKTEYRTFRNESGKTGGGKPPKSPSPLSVKIASVLGEDDPTVYGIEGGVDSLDNGDSAAKTSSSPSAKDSRPPSTHEMESTRIDVGRQTTSPFTHSKAPESQCSSLPHPCPSPDDRVEYIMKRKNNENTCTGTNIVEMQKELLSLEKQRVKLEIEKLIMEKDKLALEMDVLQLKKQKLSREHVSERSGNDPRESACSSYSLMNM